MTEPTITFTNPGATAVVVIEDVLEVSLYALDDVYEPWQTWALEETTTNATNNQIINGRLYSGYVLEMNCDITTATSTRAGAGCCLRDASDQKGGGYCLLYNVSDTAMETYQLTDAQFEASLATPYQIESVLLVDDTAESDPQFEIFECTWVTANTESTCTKLQMRPAASYTGGFRFEAENMVTGFLYDPQLTARAKWVDAEVELTGSLFNYSLSTGLLASALAFIAF